MQRATELPFTSEYRRALAQHMSQPDDASIQRAREMGSVAKSLSMLSHEVVAAHADALCADSPQCGTKESVNATLFLVEALRALESETATQRERSLRRAAHELRTPLTTLRLTLQVSLGRLEKGDTIEPAVFQKAIAQVDKLAANIAELVAPQDKVLGRTTSPEP
jgi:signal transduction histidine kinase